MPRRSKRSLMASRREAEKKRKRLSALPACPSARDEQIDHDSVSLPSSQPTTISPSCETYNMVKTCIELENTRHLNFIHYPESEVPSETLSTSRVPDPIVSSTARASTPAGDADVMGSSSPPEPNHFSTSEEISSVSKMEGVNLHNSLITILPG